MGKSNSSTFPVPFDCNDPANRMTNQQLEKLAIFAIYGWGLTYCSFLATHIFTGLLYFHGISNSLSKFCLVICLNDCLAFIAAVVVTLHEDYVQVYRSGMHDKLRHLSFRYQSNLYEAEDPHLTRLKKLLNLHVLSILRSAYHNWKLDFE